MECPACETHQILRIRTLTEGIRTRECPSCEGRWIQSDDYWRWRSRSSETLAVEDDVASPVAEDDQPALRFCPADGYILARFRVGAPHRFSVEQCRNCSGIWLDRGEWEALRAGGLARRLHLVLSEEWQDEIRAAEQKVTEDERWRSRLGDADYDRISELKRWLDSHPRRSELYAFLRFHERAV